MEQPSSDLLFPFMLPIRPLTIEVIDPFAHLAKFWLEFHGHRSESNETRRAFFEDWNNRVLKASGCDCGTHWRKAVAEKPPDFTNDETLFIWGWERHNEVNARKGALQISIDQAYQIYWPQKVSFSWRYVTFEDLMAATRKLMPKIPHNVNKIISMHRSGSPPAALIAGVLNVPCDTFSPSKGMQIAGAGHRSFSQREYYEDGTTLVIDDTVCSGYSLSKIRAWIQENDPAGNYKFAAVFALPTGTKHVDYFAEILPDPHLLEWNLFQCGWISDPSNSRPHIRGGIAFDFDGVLCEDPPRMFDEDNKDDRRCYLDWIENAQPLNPVRHQQIPLVVSYRCEYTRPATEAWLRKHGIEVKELQLFPGDPSERTWQADHWKGRIYRESHASLFIESSSDQAADIARVSNKRVLDLEQRVIIGNPSI